MGNKASRMERYYGNYEKSFERMEKDVVKVQGQLVARGRRRASLSMWSSLVTAVAVAVAGTVIYQVQQQPAGTFTYQQHFNRTAGAMMVPVCAVLLHYILALVMDMQQRRDTRKLQRLQDAKKSMVKELKDMTKFDRIKTLIDRFDPDARPAQPAVQHQGPGMMLKMNGTAGRGPQGQVARGQTVQVPAMLMKGSGQVAGAAALAVAGAGKALMPLVDKLATSLISDNPMLLEDLRCAQQQLQEAQVRTVGAVQESFAVKQENLDLKQRVVLLEKQLNLPPSFDAEALQEQQEQLHQQGQQAQQAAWQVQLQQQYMQPPAYGTEGQGSGSYEANVIGNGQASVGMGSEDGSQMRGAASSRSGSSQQLLGGEGTPVGTPKAVQ